ncbi:MAG: MBOAT family protein [Synechococcales cyanobacterium RM1_1_8]|nr:MBOAT family protein [Synechococcales cyanobacterium RM1_1_8]
MAFVSLFYALFLLLTLVFYWGFHQERLRLIVLLSASLVFFATQADGKMVVYLPLLVISTAINFYFGRALDQKALLPDHAGEADLSNEAWQYAQSGWNHQRRRSLLAGILLNVLVLLGFKYIPFFLITLGQTLQQPSLLEAADSVSRNLLVPLGISYFTFENIAYLVDVYRGAPATPSLLRFATYKFLFAKLTSGPITRYHHLSTQWKSRPFPSAEALSEALWLIARGAAKKALLADQLALVVQPGLDNLARAGSLDIWLLTLGYGLQLYLDFSGYVDMARGSAQLFGLNLPENFRSPYFSSSIADFWRRWHMTLGDWLRNYLYFPLGGSRRGLGRTCFNLMVVMLVAGFWHDASWGFLAWGAIHGAAMAVHRLTDEWSQQRPALQRWWQSPWGGVSAWALTQGVVFFSWLFFALPDVSQAWWAVTHLLGHSADGQFAQNIYFEIVGLTRGQVGLLLALLAIAMAGLHGFGRSLKVQLGWPLKLALVPLLLYGVWQLGQQGSGSYIYFNF